MNELIDSMLDIARNEVGTREGQRNNTGPRIAEYQAATALPPGPWPWCAAFTAWVLREWLQRDEVRSALKLGSLAKAEAWRCHEASAFGWESWGRAGKLKLLRETDLARAGDFVTFDFSHIGIVMADQARKGDAIETVEGNTNGRGDRDSKSGDGVWLKNRVPSLVKTYIRIFH